MKNKDGEHVRDSKTNRRETRKTQRRRCSQLTKNIEKGRDPDTKGETPSKQQKRHDKNCKDEKSRERNKRRNNKRLREKIKNIY